VLYVYGNISACSLEKRFNMHHVSLMTKLHARKIRFIETKLGMPLVFNLISLQNVE